MDLQEITASCSSKGAALQTADETYNEEHLSTKQSIPHLAECTLDIAPFEAEHVPRSKKTSLVHEGKPTIKSEVTVPGSTLSEISTIHPTTSNITATIKSQTARKEERFVGVSMGQSLDPQGGMAKEIAMPTIDLLETAEHENIFETNFTANMKDKPIVTCSGQGTLEICQPLGQDRAVGTSSVNRLSGTELLLPKSNAIEAYELSEATAQRSVIETSSMEHWTPEAKETITVNTSIELKEPSEGSIVVDILTLKPQIFHESTTEDSTSSIHQGLDAAHTEEVLHTTMTTPLSVTEHTTSSISQNIEGQQEHLVLNVVVEIDPHKDLPEDEVKLEKSDQAIQVSDARQDEVAVGALKTKTLPSQKTTRENAKTFIKRAKSITREETFVQTSVSDAAIKAEEMSNIEPSLQISDTTKCEDLVGTENAKTLEKQSHIFVTAAHEIGAQEETVHEAHIQSNSVKEFPKDDSTQVQINENLESCEPFVQECIAESRHAGILTTLTLEPAGQASHTIEVPEVLKHQETVEMKALQKIPDAGQEHVYSAIETVEHLEALETESQVKADSSQSFVKTMTEPRSRSTKSVRSSNTSEHQVTVDTESTTPLTREGKRERGRALKKRDLSEPRKEEHIVESNIAEPFDFSAHHKEEECLEVLDKLTPTNQTIVQNTGITKPLPALAAQAHASLLVDTRETVQYEAGCETGTTKKLADTVDLSTKPQVFVKAYLPAKEEEIATEEGTSRNLSGKEYQDMQQTTQQSIVAMEGAAEQLAVIQTGSAKNLFIEQHEVGKAVATKKLSEATVLQENVSETTTSNNFKTNSQDIQEQSIAAIEMSEPSKYEENISSSAPTALDDTVAQTYHTVTRTVEPLLATESENITQTGVTTGISMKKSPEKATISIKQKKTTSCIGSVEEELVKSFAANDNVQPSGQGIKSVNPHETTQARSEVVQTQSAQSLSSRQTQPRTDYASKSVDLSEVAATVNVTVESDHSNNVLLSQEWKTSNATQDLETSDSIQSQSIVFSDSSKRIRKPSTEKEEIQGTVVLSTAIHHESTIEADQLSKISSHTEETADRAGISMAALDHVTEEATVQSTSMLSNLSGNELTSCAKGAKIIQPFDEVVKESNVEVETPKSKKAHQKNTVKTRKSLHTSDAPTSHISAEDTILEAKSNPTAANIEQEQNASTSMSESTMKDGVLTSDVTTLEDLSTTLKVIISYFEKVLTYYFNIFYFFYSSKTLISGAKQVLRLETRPRGH